MDKKKLLIVDDEEPICRMLKLNLGKNEKYECMIATSGKEALELVQEHKPDLVLLDIKMPEMNGLQCLKRIKIIAPDIPVAMVTAVHDLQEARRMFEAGAYDYITKPVDFEYLKTALFVKLFC